MSISRVGTATGTTTCTVPTHSVGDIIAIWAFRGGSTTAPSLGAGYTSVLTKSGTLSSARLGYKIATATNDASGTWTNASQLTCHVYTAGGATLSAGASASSSSTNNTVNYPALTLTNGDGTSWVLGFGGVSNTTETITTAPTGMGNRSSVTGASAAVAGHDTNAGVSSWSSTNATTTGTAGNSVSATFEIAVATDSGKRVQGAISADSPAASTTVSATFAAPVASGGAVLGILLVGAGTAGTITITDDKGNTYAKPVDLTDATESDRMVMFYCLNITNAPSTITVTSSISDQFRLIIDEYTGLSAFDTSNGTARAIGATVTSATATPTGSSDLAYGAVVVGTAAAVAITAAGGYTKRSSSGASDSFVFASEDKLLSNTTPVGASFGLAGTTNGGPIGVMTFTTGGGGGGGGGSGITAIAPSPTFSRRRFGHLPRPFVPRTIAPYGNPGTPKVVWWTSSASNVQALDAASGDNFKLRPANNTKAGNALVLKITYPHAKTPVVTDTNGNTWPAVSSMPTVDAGVGGLITSVFVLPNANAGYTVLNVAFGSLVTPFFYEYGEITNIALSNPINGWHAAANQTGTSIAAGSFTPTTNNDTLGGNFILAFCDECVDGGEGSPTAFAPGGSFQLLSANTAAGTTQNGYPHSAMYWVQATQAAVNPTFTLTGGNSFNALALALKAVSAGSDRDAGIHVKNILHNSRANPPTSNWQMQVPASGNLWVLEINLGELVTAVSDNSDGFTAGQWVKEGSGAFYTGIWYREGVSPKNDLVIRVDGIPSGGYSGSVRFYDIEDAAASSVLAQTKVVASGDCSSITVLNNAPTFTPSAAAVGGLIITGGGLGQGPSYGFTTGAPSGAFFDLPNYDTQTDVSTMDNSDMSAHYYVPDTTTLHFNYSIASIASNSYDVVAVAFKTADTSSTPRNASVSSTLDALTSPSTTANVVGTASETSTLAALTSSATTTVLVQASLTGTLGALTSAATVADPDTASASGTLNALTASSTAAVIDQASVTGTLDAVTSSATGQTIDNASVNGTLDALTLSAFASGGSVNGSLSEALADLTSSANVQVVVQAAVDAALGALTGISTVSDPEVGSVSGTLGALTSSATTKVLLQAAVSSTLDALTCSASAAAVDNASLNATLDTLTIFARASEGSDVLDLSQTLEDLTAVATATVQSQASVNVTLGSLTSSSTATDPDVVSVSGTLAPVTAVATATVVSNASANVTLADMAGVASAVDPDKAAVSGTLAALTVSATAVAVVKAAVNVTLDGLSEGITAHTDAPDHVSVAAQFDPLTADITAVAIISARSTPTLASLTVDASAESWVVAHVNAVLASVTVVARALLEKVIVPPERMLVVPHETRMLEVKPEKRMLEVTSH
jgi:hypothetical protein